MIAKRNIVILLLVVALLAAGIYAALSYNPDGGGQDGEASQIITIYDGDKNDFAKITVETPEAQFAFVQGANGDYSAEGQPGIVLNLAAVDALFGEFAPLNAKSIATEAADSLDDYGLSEPAAKITVEERSGNLKVFRIGGTAAENARFLNVDGAMKIYTIPSTTANALRKPFVDYRETDVLSVDTSRLARIVIHGPGPEISLEQGTQTQAGSSNAGWTLRAPIEKEADAEKVQTNILSKIETLTVSQFVDDAPTDDSQYGIGEQFVYLEDMDGQSQKLFVGQLVSGEYYVRIDGTNNVFSVAQDSLSFIGLDASKLISSLLFVPSVNDVSAVTISFADKTFQMEIAKTGETDDMGDEVLAYTLNGQTMPEDAFSPLYQTVIGLSISGVRTEPVSGSPVVTILYQLNDGTQKELAFYPDTDRSYAVLEDGVPSFSTLKKGIDEMRAALEDALL